MLTFKAAFDRIADSICDLKHAGLDAIETQRQLETLQRQAVRLHFKAAADGVLPAWLARPADDSAFERELLPLWELLARSLEREHPGRTVRVDDVSDARIPLVGTDRAIHVAPPERVRLWAGHAEGVVRLLGELTDDRTAGPSEAGKARTPRETWLAEALLLRRDNPYWSARQIAKVVNVNPSTLARSDEFKRATEAARERHAPPRGRVENGRIDAPVDGRRPAVDDDE